MILCQAVSPSVHLATVVSKVYSAEAGGGVLVAPDGEIKEAPRSPAKGGSVDKKRTEFATLSATSENASASETLVLSSPTKDFAEDVSGPKLVIREKENDLPVNESVGLEQAGGGAVGASSGGSGAAGGSSDGQHHLQRGV